VGAECGTIQDGCGNTVHCNLCYPDASCNSANACIPNANFSKPTGINICVTAGNSDLSFPAIIKNVLSCDTDWYFCAFVDATCCIPDLCLLDPTCVITNALQEAPEIILHPGDPPYCSTTITPLQFGTLAANGQITNLSELLSEGWPGGILGLYSLYTNILTAAGVRIPLNIQNLITALIQPLYDGGLNGFKWSDMQSAEITSSSMPSARFFGLGAYRSAITLGPVIVLEKDYYDAIVSAANANVIYADFLTSAAVSDTFVMAVDTLIRELVHVKQYNNRSSFQLNYVVPAAVNALDANNALEQEAYTYEISVGETQQGRLCTVMAPYYNGDITKWNLSISPPTCVGTTPWLGAVCDSCGGGTITNTGTCSGTPANYGWVCSDYCCTDICGIEQNGDGFIACDGTCQNIDCELPSYYCNESCN
jgi:hypothetical protein